MNTEHLQMILNTIQALGVEGKELLILWLILDHIVPVIGWLVTFFGICWMVLRALLVVRAHAYMRQWRDKLHIGCPGYLSQDEFDRVVQKIDSLIERAK